jgi:hypothetical protein
MPQNILYTLSHMRQIPEIHHCRRAADGVGTSIGLLDDIHIIRLLLEGIQVGFHLGQVTGDLVEETLEYRELIEIFRHTLHTNLWRRITEILGL